MLALVDPQLCGQVLWVISSMVWMQRGNARKRKITLMSVWHVCLYSAFVLYGLKPAKLRDLKPVSKTHFPQKKQPFGPQRAWTHCVPCQWKVRHQLPMLHLCPLSSPPCLHICWSVSFLISPCCISSCAYATAADKCPHPSVHAFLTLNCIFFICACT